MMLLARVPLADKTIKESHQSGDTVSMVEPLQYRKFKQSLSFYGSSTAVYRQHGTRVVVDKFSETSRLSRH
jgi:hypothetical protein